MLQPSVDEFAAEVGVTGPVTIVGSGSRGGGPVGDEHVVSAPSGIERIDAAEMVIECGAGTAVVDVQAALAKVGQTVSLPRGGTVGGALAVGHSDITRLGHGAMRDVLLRTRYVSAAGHVVTAGGATVKNVSGFDLCRLLVGSRGTLGFFGDVLLRTRPLAPDSRWFRTNADPFQLLSAIYRPVSILWNGSTTWVRLDGDSDDLNTAAARNGLEPADGPPDLPSAYRWSLPPAALPSLRSRGAGEFVAEVGVGVVHHTEPQSDRLVDQATRTLHDRLRSEFDPVRRLNPGVDPLA